MKNLLKNRIAKLYEVLGWIDRRRRSLANKVLVLTYHGVIPEKLIRRSKYLFEYRNVVTQEEFSRQMEYLINHYIPISIHDFPTLKKRLSNRPYVVVTFDDGFENNFLYAFPVLKKYGIVGHFFLTTGFLGTRKMLWTEEVTYRIMHTRNTKLNISINGKQFLLPTATISQKESSSVRFRNYLKLQSYTTIQTALMQLRELTSDLNIDNLQRERYQFMSWEQVREMHRAGMILGSHTSHHFLLNNLNSEEVRQTLFISKQNIEKEIQTSYAIFSYPNGQQENYSERDKQILEELGFHYAFTQINGFNSIEMLESQKFQLFRINISYYMKIPIFNAVISGLWRNFKHYD